VCAAGVAEGGSQSQQLTSFLLDLKGVLYNSTVVPLAGTAMAVNIGPGDARVSFPYAGIVTALQHAADGSVCARCCAFSGAHLSRYGMMEHSGCACMAAWSSPTAYWAAEQLVAYSSSSRRRRQVCTAVGGCTQHLTDMLLCGVTCAMRLSPHKPV
jgi:hypothetical protein